MSDQEPLLNLLRRAGPSGEQATAQEAVSILLVDDQPANLAALEASLERMGQRLVQTTSGREALRACLHEEFAVILLDVKMPGLNGFETAALIRDRDRSRHTPIIFLTAYDTGDAQVAQGYAMGAVDYLFKPFDADLLRAKVQVFIDLFRKTREVQRLNAELERRVAERTQELERANEQLQDEVAERRRAEARVRQLNAELEQRVQDRTAALEAANRDLQSFSYSVSHDLRAPLRKINAFSRLLLDDHREALDGEGRAFLDRIHHASRHMDGLIEDMLKLALVSRETLALEEVDLSALAREILEELQRAEPGRVVDVSVAPSLTAWGDPGLLRLALQNLLNNAWKFTARKPSSEITFGAETPAEGPRTFYIRDSGAGFDMGQVSRLFNPFQRLHAASDFKGTGIGLAIVARVIRRHGGQVWGEGVPEEGATFYFTLGTTAPAANAP